MESQGTSNGEATYTVIWSLWLGSWDSALTALATATRCGTLGTNQVAAHKAVIADEREAVTKQFTRLLKASNGEVDAWLGSSHR